MTFPKDRTSRIKKPLTGKSIRDFNNVLPSAAGKMLLDTIERRLESNTQLATSIGQAAGVVPSPTPGPPTPPVPPPVPDIVVLTCLKVNNPGGIAIWDFVRYTPEDGAVLADCSIAPAGIVATHVVVRVEGAYLYLNTAWADGAANLGAGKGSDPGNPLYTWTAGKVTDAISDLRYTDGPQKGRLKSGIYFVQVVGRKVGTFVSGDPIGASDLVQQEQR